MSVSPAPSRAMRSEAKNHLRGLRRKLKVTQQELANSSDVLTTPISREFIANLESAGLPGTVKKFFTYSWLTGADLGLLQELVASDDGLQQERPALDDALDVCRRLSDEGDHRQAVTVALSAAREAQVSGLDAAYAQLLLASAVAAKRGGLWRLGRELAEEAHASGHLSEVNEARATITIAQALSMMNRTLMALSMMKTVNKSLFDQMPDLGASYWHDMAVFLRAENRLSEALEAVEKGLVFYAQTNRFANCAVLVSVRAVLTAKLHSADRAMSIVGNALETVGKHQDDVVSRAHVLVNAGLVGLAAGDLDYARKHFEEAEALAVATSHDEVKFKAGMGLCDVAYRDKRRAEARRMLKELHRDSLNVRMDRFTRSVLEELTQRVSPRR